MAIVVNMPRLSDTMEEGTVAAWLKKVGDKIEEGDILAEIETDKATMEFESFNEGTLLHIGVQEGETTKVDELLAIIGDEGEDISALLNGGGNASAESTEEEAPAVEAAPEATTSAAAELPEGVIVVTMPRLSDTMEEGTVATWGKKVGDEVEEGHILAKIETDKATIEFESFQAGTLLYIGLQEGDSAKVDELLAIIGPAGTDVSGVASSFSTAAPAAKAEAPKKAAEPKKVEAPKVETAKAAAPVAPKKSNDGGRLFVSPLAKKIAEEKGFNISDISGSGEGGRIIKRDVENFTPQAAAPVAVAAGPAVANEESFEEVKNSNMRKAIAKNLAKSKFTAPHYYLNVEFDMDNAIAFRKEVNAVPDTKVSFNDIVVKACAMALKEHPQVNSQWFDDKMKLNNHVHIGVAVAVEDGLLVPVVKFADQRKLTQIGAAVKEYAIKAKTKKLSLEEMEGSTFTISNLGMFGIETFTSIINQPNSAILSVGAIVQKPVVKDGAIVVGNTMKLCLAADHRTIDGATGAQFLQTLKGYIENPISMLL